MTWRDYLFSFKGRASRLDCWRFQLWSALAFLPIMAATVFTVRAGGPGVVPFLFILPLLASAVAIAVRRLHDRDRSWWWVLIFGAGPFALYGLASLLSAVAGDAASLLVLPGVLLNLWGWVEIAVLRGTRGPNRFGPDQPSWPPKRKR